MALWIITTSLLALTEFSQAYKCLDLPKIVAQVEEIWTDFRFDRAKDFSDSKLKVIYRWNVVDRYTRKPIADQIDGFAYKFITREEHEYKGYIFYNSLDDYDDAICAKAAGNVWSRDSETPCQLPCKGRFSPICNDSSVCTMLSLGYKTLPWNATQLEFPVEFGRIYEVHIVPYRKWKIGHGATTDGLGVVKYCKDELIQHQNVTHDQAHIYCGNLSMFDADTRPHSFSGPVSHFEKYDVTIDYHTNRAKVSFRWKIPYDYHPKASLAKYLITLDGETNTLQNLSTSEYNIITIDDVMTGRLRSIKVVPVLRYNESADGVTIVHGAYLYEEFIVKDFDACKEDNEVGGRYCDAAANCTNLPPEANASALCTCPQGYHGNGISEQWTGGLGCEDGSIKASSVAWGVSIAIVVILIIILLVVCDRRRRLSVRRRVLRDDESI